MNISKTINGFQFELSDIDYDYQVDVTHDNKVTATKVDDNHETTPHYLKEHECLYFIKLKDDRVNKANRLKECIGFLSRTKNKLDLMLELYQSEFDECQNGEDDVICKLGEIKELDFRIEELKTIYREQFELETVEI